MIFFFWSTSCLFAPELENLNFLTFRDKRSPTQEFHPVGPAFRGTGFSRLLCTSRMDFSSIFRGRSLTCCRSWNCSIINWPHKKRINAVVSAIRMFYLYSLLLCSKQVQRNKHLQTRLRYETVNCMFAFFDQYWKWLSHIANSLVFFFFFLIFYRFLFLLL